MQRLIKKEDIPRTLWEPDHGRIHLAPDLIHAWKSLLNYSGLFEKAHLPVPRNLVGGVTKADTDDHLAWRFSGSSARVQLGILDPRGNLSGISDAFARIFSGGTVLIADLPCGSGAALLTILSTIAELRRENRLPREPLHIKIVGGEISEFAREYAEQAIGYIKDSLADQAIWVSAEFISWDVLNRFSTADLSTKLTLTGSDCTARLLILANFSGFLQADGKWKLAKQQFENLFMHCRNNESYAIWIEPPTNTVLANGGFFGRLIGWFNDRFSPLRAAEDPGPIKFESLGKCSAKVQHPLREEHQFDVGLVIQRFDLPKSGGRS